MGRGELQGRQAVQAPNWGAAAAERAVLLLGEHGMPAVYSRILEWHMEDAAAAAAAAGMIVGCSGHLMAAVLKVDMAEKEAQSSGEHCMRRVLHAAERGAAVAADGCSGSS